MRRSSRVRALLTAVLVSMSLFMGVGAALAAGPVDDSGYTQAERDAAQEEAAKGTAERTCKLFLKGPTALLQGKCVEAMSSEFTVATVPKLAALTLCGAVTRANKLMGAGCMAVLATQTDNIQGWFWEAYETALSTAEVVEGTVVAFVANAQFGWQAFLNGMKEDGVSMFSSVMKSVTDTSSFDPTAQWWRDTYAAAAGIGMALLALGLFSTAWQHSRGLLGPVEARDAMLLYPMIAVVMTVFGPPFAWSLTYVASGLSSGIIDWMGPDVVTFLERGAGFVFLTSKIPGGGIMGFIIFLLLVVGALGVWGMFLFQTVSAYVLGAVAGASWGMSANPRWRAKALAVPMFVVALIFAQPAMLFVLGVVTKMTNAIDLTPTSADEGLRLLTNALMTVIALVIVAFSPIALLKWFPLLPDGADSVRSSGPVGLTAAVGAAGSTAQSAAMMRARGGGGGGGGTRGAGKTPTATGGPPPAPAGPTGAGSLAPKNPAPGGAAAKAMGGRTGGSRALTGGGARTAAGGGTRAAAGGGSRAAAGAAGGAASGGALLAAQLAASAANAAVQKARETADAATPEVRS